MTSARWVEAIRSELRRGRHVILHGNVHDKALWEGDFWDFDEVLDLTLTAERYGLRVRYDLVRSIQFSDDAMREQFLELSSPAPETPTGARVVAMPEGRDPPRNAARLLFPRQAEALAAVRQFLTNSRERLASAVIHFADKLFTSAEHQSADERQLMVQLALMASESYQRTELEAEEGKRNALILVAPIIGQVPSWLYRENPLFQLIEIGRPSARDRRAYVSANGQRFHGGGDTVPDQLREDFVSLTEGFPALDLDRLRLTSLHEGLPLTECVRLVDFFKHGKREDPWRDLTSERLRAAESMLSGRVFGQEAAVDAAVGALMRSRSGINVEGSARSRNRPKAALFFVGPTGVGKTELAKAMTELVFRDEAACIRLDMSEYSEEHAATRLVGAPPSYVGHEAGGQLTNAVMERPHALILLDEIDKAHPRVLDKLLQVLDDGRLTDGRGQTVHFDKVLIVFTSNIGSTRQRNDNTVELAVTPDMSREAVRDHYQSAVRAHFLEQKRPELLGRIGRENVIVFEPLRADSLDRVARKFLDGLRQTVRDEYGTELVFDESVFEELRSECDQPRGAELGGRVVRDLIETRIADRLARYVVLEDELSPRLRVSARSNASGGWTVDIRPEGGAG